MAIKFFKLVMKTKAEEFYDLFICDSNTPIPTLAEIIDRNNLNPEIAKCSTVVEISKKEFLKLHNDLLADIFSSPSNDAIEWAPNDNRGLCTWEYWYSEEELEDFE